MKKVLFVCASIFFFANLSAQEHDQPEPNVDSMLVNIDKSDLTSGILYERVFPWSHLDYFNDSLRISNVDHFEQAIYELYLSSNKRHFMHYDTLRGRYLPDSLQNQVSIGVINASFHTLNYNAENPEQGGLRIVDSLFEKIQNDQPAFLENHVFVASPLKNFVKGEQIVYRFDNDFLLQNNEEKSITRLTVNFGTETDYVLMENGTIINNAISISYQEGGKKELVFTAEYSDDTVLTSTGILDVSISPPSPPDGLVEDGSISANILYQGIGEPASFYGYIEYRIFYRNDATEKKLMKPIIIIDGFDPGDRRKIEDSDPRRKKTDKEHRSILEVMTYNNGESILNDLRELGYDVVIVNHPTYTRFYEQGTVPDLYLAYEIDGGADFIQRNARAHIALYQDINAKLAANNSTEQLVIVGPSMGGQISRYALAYMEEQYAIAQEQKWDHNTRLWVSVDSPHLGANIPIGAQALLNILAEKTNSVEAEDFVSNQLRSVAAKQQLISQYKGVIGTELTQGWLNGRTIGQGFSQDRGHPFFIQYYNDLYSNGLPNSRGYPQNVRRIAVANGALTGTRAFGNPFAPESTGYNNGVITPDQYAGNINKVFRINGYEHFFHMHLATLEYYFMPSTNNHHKVAYFKKRGKGLFNLGWYYYHRYVVNYDSRGNLDNISGGWYPTQQEIGKSVAGSSPCDDNICINSWNIDAIDHVSSFIPTMSALAIVNPDIDWAQEFDCTMATPFDNYYGPKINERHTSFTEESMEWLKEELSQDNEFPAPTIYVDNAILNGPELVCSQEETYWFAPGVCNGLVAENWQVSPNLQIVSSDDHSITVKPFPNASGEGFVKAILPYDIAKKDFWVGKPDGGPSGIVNGNIDIYSYGYMNTLYISPIPDGVSGPYRWQITANGSNPNCQSQYLPKYFDGITWNSALSIFYASSPNIDWGFCTGSYTIRCYALNACGEDLIGVSYVTIHDPNSSENPCDPVLEIYPNPTNNLLNVAVTENRTAPCADEADPLPLAVNIYDMNGNPQYSENFEEMEFTHNRFGIGKRFLYPERCYRKG